MSGLSAEYVRERLAYDPDTGALTWLHNPSMPSAWNGRWAGKQAGAVDGTGTRKISIDAKAYLAHRIAWLHSYGSWPAEQIDHINRDRSDNRLINLRAATCAENLRNTQVRRDSSTGAKGVFVSGARYYARCRNADGKLVYLGTYPTIEAAKAVRDEFAAREHGEFFRP